MKRMQVKRDHGQIAVEVGGSGPLILCVPGMGESHASFARIVPGLADAGYRVAVMDLRGHGDSSVEFAAYDDPAVAGDILAVIEALDGGPATVVGNSMGAAAGVLAAAERPDAIARLALIGPFVRDHGSAATRLMLRLLLARPWGPTAWRKFYTKLFSQPKAHAGHIDRSIDLLRRPGRWRAFQTTTRTSHAQVEAALPAVSKPTLVIMGDQDRDFPDPEAEARWVAEALSGQHHMITQTGHYPMLEDPGAVLEVLLPFVASEQAHV